MNLDSYFGKGTTEELHFAAERPTLRWNLGEYMKHWSPSSFSMLQRCSYQFQQRYIKGLKERPGEAPVVGTAVHAGIERNFRQKVDSGVDLPVAELVEWYADAGWAATLEREQKDEEVMWDSDPELAKQRGKVMLAAYQNAVAPRIQPRSVEGEIEAHLGLAVPVVGRFDVERDESVIDVKTGKRTQKKPKEAWRIQAAVYGEVRERPVEFHSVSATAKNVVTIVTPLEEEALLLHPSPRERREMMRTLRFLSAWACLLMDIYGPDEPWPTNGRFHEWACSYCGFRAGCPAWEEES